MLPTEDLFVYACVLIHDLITAGAITIPPRPGPEPGCSDAELLAIALVRHLLRQAQQGWIPGRGGPELGELYRACRTKARRTGGSAGYGAHSSSSGRRWRCTSPKTTASRSTPAPCQSSTPPGPWPGPVDRPGQRPGRPVRRDAAHAEWFYGFRLAIRTDGTRIVRAWPLVPAAIDERQPGTDLAAGDAASIDALLLDKAFTGRRITREMASAGIDVIIPPTGVQRKTTPRTLQRLIARLRNRAETSVTQITGQTELAATARTPSKGS